MILVLLPYKILIEFTMTLMAIPTINFLVSFVLLRVQRPTLKREFKIPGGTMPGLRKESRCMLSLNWVVVHCLGTCGAVVMILPPIVITCMQAYFTMSAKGAGESGGSGEALKLGHHPIPYPGTLPLRVSFLVAPLASLDSSACRCRVCSKHGLAGHRRHGCGGARSLQAVRITAAVTQR
jgi:hypothetical protein